MIVNLSDNEFIGRLSELIERVGSTLGSQSSDVGTLVLTQTESLELACKEFFTCGCTIHPTSFAAFESRFGGKHFFEDDSVENLIAALKPLNPSVAYVVLFESGGEDRDRDPVVDGGSYCICLFIDAMQQASTRILISFPRYED